MNSSVGKQTDYVHLLMYTHPLPSLLLDVLISRQLLPFAPRHPLCRLPLLIRHTLFLVCHQSSPPHTILLHSLK